MFRSVVPAGLLAVAAVFAGVTVASAQNSEQVGNNMAAEEMDFVYIKIPENIGPATRGEKYGDPLSERLGAASLGEVTGGGSQLGENDATGKPTVEFCGIDVDVTDLHRALALIRTELVRLGAPAGTELHYTSNGQRMQDELGVGGWVLERPRTFLHPGFGV